MPPASALLLLLLLLLAVAVAVAAPLPPAPPLPPAAPPPLFPPLFPPPLLEEEEEPPAAPCGLVPVCCSSNDRKPTELLLLKLIGERDPDATKNAAPTRASTTATTEIVRPERGRDDDDDGAAEGAGIILFTAPPSSSSALGERNVSSLPYDCRAFALLDDMTAKEPVLCVRRGIWGCMYVLSAFAPLHDQIYEVPRLKGCEYILWVVNFLAALQSCSCVKKSLPTPELVSAIRSFRCSAQQAAPVRSNSIDNDEFE